MPIEFVPFEEQHLPAVLRFNQRLLAGNAVTPFLMQEEATTPPPPDSPSHLYVAADDDEIRGGFLEVIYPATVAGVEAEAINCQSPLSEGLVDKKYLMLPAQMFKVMQRHNPYVFVVGMGGLHNPLPRFLKAAGWSVEEVPFYYKVIRASRFLREMPALQKPLWKQTAARIASVTGAGSIAFSILHRSSGTAVLNRWTIEKGAWGAWTTDVWNRFRTTVRFAVSRDEPSIQRLYHGAKEIGPLVIKRDGVVCGWSMVLLTQMRDNSHFGNLLVGTILDCIADEGSRVAAIEHTVQYLSGLGADIVVTNQSHTSWRNACLSAGFRGGPSNYVLAASPKLVKAIGAAPVESGTVFITRADGDGRINL